VISPLALGRLGDSAAGVRDRFSAAYLVSAAARTIRDVAVLRQRAGKAGKRLATLTLETEIRFASADARRQFTQELLDAAAQLASKYNSQSPGGRSFRFVLAGYPAITKEEPADSTSVTME
jgi:hypothetical protein